MVNTIIDPSYGVYTNRGQRSLRLTYFVSLQGYSLCLVCFIVDEHRSRFARYFSYLDFLFYLTFVIMVSSYLHLKLPIKYGVPLHDELGCPIVSLENSTLMSLHSDLGGILDHTVFLFKVLLKLYYR